MAKNKSETYSEALSYLKKHTTLFGDTKEIHRVPTGIIGLDWLLGGGVPDGRIVELFGVEGSGKTTLVAEIAAVYQKLNRVPLYLDFEHSVDLSWFRKIGVDTERDWEFAQPFSLEEGMTAAIRLVKTGGLGLLVVDSLAAMVPKKELEGDFDNQVALQARQIGKAFRLLVGALEKTNTAAIFINQVREKIGGAPLPFPVYSTPGGRAPKFYSSIRIETKNGKGGKKILNLKKQKTCSLQNASVEICIGERGIDRVQHLKDMALRTVVKNKAGSYFVRDKKICRGEEDFNLYCSNPKAQEILSRMILKYLNSATESVWG